MQKALYLVGSGANGKSVYLNKVSALMMPNTEFKREFVAILGISLRI